MRQLSYKARFYSQRFFLFGLTSKQADIQSRLREAQSFLISRLVQIRPYLSLGLLRERFLRHRLRVRHLRGRNSSLATRTSNLEEEESKHFVECILLYDILKISLTSLLLDLSSREDYSRNTLVRKATFTKSKQFFNNKRSRLRKKEIERFVEHFSLYNTKISSTSLFFANFFLDVLLEMSK